MAVLIRDQPHRSCATKTNAISVEGLSEEIHESPLSSHSREHIFNILHLLDVNAENVVLHLPSVEQLQSATVKEDFVISDGFRRVQSLFWKGVKGWIKILLPSWSLPQDKVLKDLCQLPSGPFEDMHVAEVDASHDHSEDKVDHSLVTASIIKSLKHEKTYRTMNARFFLAPLGKMPTHFWINDLCMGETTAGELKLQAQVDAEYLSRGLPLQWYTKSISRVEDNVVESLVHFVYSDENVARLAWVPRKALLTKNKQWSVLNHWAAMKSLFLKRDIAAMYSLYAQRASAAHKVIGKSLFLPSYITSQVVVARNSLQGQV